MRLHRLSTALVAVALTASLAACGDDDEPDAQTPSTSGSASAPSFAAGTTMATLQSAGVLKVGTKFDQPGFGLKGLGDDPEGFDVEIAKIIATELGIATDKIEYTESPSMIRESLIQDGKVNLVSATYTINDKRKQLITFAGPYYTAGQDLMVKKDNTTITGPESLKAAGVKVCSVTGSTPAEKILEYVDKSKLVLFDVYSKCADALRTNQVAAVTTDNVILLGLIDKNPNDFKILEKPFTQEPYGIGIKKGDVAFCEFINASLTKASADGRYAKAWADTAGKFSPTPPTLPTLAPCA
jgi:glutamate transport system substrate-binding protein